MRVPAALEQLAEPGLGVSARVSDQWVHVGQARYLAAVGVDMPPPFLEHAAELRARGLTVALASAGGRLAAMGFADEPRPEAIGRSALPA
jgi:cation transport ATPase